MRTDYLEIQRTLLDKHLDYQTCWSRYYFFLWQGCGTVAVKEEKILKKDDEGN